jgi:hypothetical protein
MREWIAYAEVETTRALGAVAAPPRAVGEQLELL